MVARYFCRPPGALRRGGAVLWFLLTIAPTVAAWMVSVYISLITFGLQWMISGRTDTEIILNPITRWLVNLPFRGFRKDHP